MRWSILTPDRSVFWDTRELHFGPGVPRSQAPQGDDLEDLWRTYYERIRAPIIVCIGYGTGAIRYFDVTVNSPAETAFATLART